VGVRARARVSTHLHAMAMNVCVSNIILERRPRFEITTLKYLLFYICYEMELKQQKHRPHFTCIRSEGFSA